MERLESNTNFKEFLQKNSWAKVFLAVLFIASSMIIMTVFLQSEGSLPSWYLTVVKVVTFLGLLISGFIARIENTKAARIFIFLLSIVGIAVGILALLS